MSWGVLATMVLDVKEVGQVSPVIRVWISRAWSPAVQTRRVLSISSSPYANSPRHIVMEMV